MHEIINEMGKENNISFLGDRSMVTDKGNQLGRMLLGDDVYSSCSKEEQ